MNNFIRWPLTLNRIRKDKESNCYGRFENRHSGAHWGWDFTAQVGTPVFAIANGTISQVYGRKSDKPGAFGLVVELCFQYHGKNHYAAYCHLSRTSVKKGQSILIGQLIGYTGKSGNANNLPADEDHLHFEIRSRSRPEPGGYPDRIDPKDLFVQCPIGHTIVDTIGID